MTYLHQFDNNSIPHSSILLPQCQVRSNQHTIMSNIIICLHYKPQKTQANYKLDTGKAHTANGENWTKRRRKRGEKVERVNCIERRQSRQLTFNLLSAKCELRVLQTNMQKIMWKFVRQDENRNGNNSYEFPIWQMTTNQNC